MAKRRKEDRDVHLSADENRWTIEWGAKRIKIKYWET